MSEQKHTPGPLLKQIQDWVNMRRLDGTSSYSGGYNDGMDEVIGLVATYEKANGAAPELLQQVAELEAERSEVIRRIKSILKASTVHDKISILEELEQLLNSLKTK